jgi:hypothetical protein
MKQSDELFRETQQRLLELTLWKRLVKIFLKMVAQLASILNFVLDETMEKIMHSDQSCEATDGNTKGI